MSEEGVTVSEPEVTCRVTGMTIGLLATAAPAAVVAARVTVPLYVPAGSEPEKTKTDTTLLVELVPEVGEADSHVAGAPPWLTPVMV